MRCSLRQPANFFAACIPCRPPGRRSSSHVVPTRAPRAHDSFLRPRWCPRVPQAAWTRHSPGDDLHGNARPSPLAHGGRPCRQRHSGPVRVRPPWHREASWLAGIRSIPSTAHPWHMGTRIVHPGVAHVYKRIMGRGASEASFDHRHVSIHTVASSECSGSRCVPSSARRPSARRST